MERSSKHKIFLICSIVLIGLNLRPIMAAIGPILPLLQQDLGISSRDAAMLTTLPVAMMGLFALSGPWLRSKIGEYSGISLGLLALLIANLARYLTNGISLLIITAIIGGIGIAIIQSLMPAFLKNNFQQKADSLLGLFSTGIMGGAAVAAALSAPVANYYHWNVSLGLAGIPVLFACIAWALLGKDKQKKNLSRGKLPVGSKHAWLLMIFFGIGTGAYTLVLAWLSPYYIQLGWDANKAGYALAFLTLTEVSAGFLISILVAKIKNFRLLLTGVLVMLMAGLLLLVFLPVNFAILAIILLGLSIGSLFSLSLIMTMNYAKSNEETASLLAFVQGGGYLLAATFPFIAGAIRDGFASLQWAWGFMFICSVFLMVICQWIFVSQSKQAL